MEMEINSLIEKIKKDGVQEAEKKSEGIVKEAGEKAKDIVSSAQEEARNIVQDAEKEGDKLRKLAEESIRHSVRDIVLMLKQKLIAVSDTILKREVSKQMTTSLLKDSIVKLIENFRKDGMLDVEILLGKEDKEKMEKAVLDTLTSEMRKGVTIKLSPDIETGFRIGKKGENYYYDFTDEAVTEALRQYLNPKINNILDVKS